MLVMRERACWLWGIEQAGGPRLWPRIAPKAQSFRGGWENNPAVQDYGQGLRRRRNPSVDALLPWRVGEWGDLGGASLNNLSILVRCPTNSDIPRPEWGRHGSPRADTLGK